MLTWFVGFLKLLYSGACSKMFYEKTLCLTTGKSTGVSDSEVFG